MLILWATMTRLAMAMAPLLVLARAGVAQVREIRYQPLAAAAQVQGDVRLRSGPDGVVPISGHPILVRAAMASMGCLRELSEPGDAEVVFHFCLSDTSMREVVYPELPENRIDSAKAPVEVWVYGSRRCSMVESFGVATD